MNKKLFRELKRLAIGLPFILAVCIFIGCASTGGGSKEPPGTLTITGIPAEYEGKFASTQIKNVTYVDAKGKSSSRNVEGESTVITNGEARLPLSYFALLGKGGGYAGSDTVEVDLTIYERDAQGGLVSTPSRAVFPSVEFQGGVAKAHWDDAAKACIITVTNIPQTYPDGFNVSVLIGMTSYPLGIPLTTPYGSTWVRNGAARVPVLPSSFGDGVYSSYTEDGEKDIVFSVSVPVEGKVIGQRHDFLFKAVNITDNEAVIDFRNGDRIK
jgi:hypothetical protein